MLIARRSPPELPPWLFMLVGIVGFLMARGGITVDLMCTAADALRTLAMLGVIVFGCFMVLRDVYKAQPRVPPPPPADTVTISAQQFKILLSLASANAAQLTAAPEVEPVAVEPVAAEPVVATEPAEAAEAEKVAVVEEKPQC